MDRVNVGARAAEAKIKALLALEPGEQVYVVPFHKRATLIRVQADKDLAVVQSGIFEMQIPLVDLEPLQAPPAAAKSPRKKPPEKKPAGQSENVEPGGQGDKKPGGDESPQVGEKTPDPAERPETEGSAH